MGAKKLSQKGKGTYAVYKAKDQYTKNRKRRLERHLKAYPGDEAAQAALKNIEYRRYTPKTRGGWVIARRDTHMVGLTFAEAKAMAFIKKNERKVLNELRFNRDYQKLLAEVAVAESNRKILEQAKGEKRNKPGGKPQGKGGGYKGNKPQTKK